MARQITKKRGKSPIKTRLEQERKSARKDPKGKKSVVSKAAIASLAIPGSLGVKAATKAVKAGKTVTRPSVLPKGKANIRTSLSKEAARKKRRDAAKREAMKKARERVLLSRLLKEKAPKPPRQSPKEAVKKKAANIQKQVEAAYRKGEITKKEQDMIMNSLRPLSKMKKGGIVKSHRGDGIAKRGKTKGRII